MKKITHERRICPRAGEKKQVKKRGDRPLPQRIKDHALHGLKLSRRIFKKLEDVEDLIEIIAREIKRQLDRVQ